MRILIRMNSTIYIRKENEARWNGIKDKSAWVNAYLSKSPPNSIVTRDKLEVSEEFVAPKVDVTDLIKSGATPTPAPKYDPVVAERQLSGELSCCQNETRPCKHWVWDVQTGEGYVNTLSGRQVEVE